MEYNLFGRVGMGATCNDIDEGTLVFGVGMS